MADAAFELVLAWADDVVDGLWPGTHPGATQHDRCLVGKILERLDGSVSDDLGIDENEIRRFLAIDARQKPGGQGKIF